jgi:hypothetical protein
LGEDTDKPKAKQGKAKNAARKKHEARENPEKTQKNRNQKQTIPLHPTLQPGKIRDCAHRAQNSKLRKPKTKPKDHLTA